MATHPPKISFPPIHPSEEVFTPIGRNVHRITPLQKAIDAQKVERSQRESLKTFAKRFPQLSALQESPPSSVSTLTPSGRLNLREIRELRDSADERLRRIQELGEWLSGFSSTFEKARYAAVQRAGVARRAVDQEIKSVTSPRQW